MRICTCGAGGECLGDCAGAIKQRMECAERGHMTSRGIAASLWGTPLPKTLQKGDYCYHCGEEGPK